MADLEIMEQEESGTTETIPAESSIREDNHDDPNPVEVVRDWSVEIAGLEGRIRDMSTRIDRIERGIMDARTTTEVSDDDVSEGVEKGIDDLFVEE